jgi:hypothetical protein
VSAVDLRPRSYRVVLPPQWWAIELDEGSAEKSVAALVRRQFTGIDDAPLARQAVAEYLMQQVERAREANGIELYLSTFRTGEIVLPASLLICYSPRPSREIPLEDLAEVLAVSEAASSVRSVEVRPLPVGQAIRRLSYWAVVEDPTVEPVPAINLDWHLPVPAGEGALVTLSFATGLVTLEEPLLGLFDAIASTFEWTW